MLRELEDALLVNKDTELRDVKLRRLGPSAEAEEKADIEGITKNKIDDLWNIFAVADPQNLQRRVCLGSLILLEIHVHTIDHSQRKFQITSSTAFPSR